MITPPDVVERDNLPQAACAALRLDERSAAGLVTREAVPAAMSVRVADYYFAAADNAFYNPTLRMSLLEVFSQSREMGDTVASYAHLILTPELCRQAHAQLITLAHESGADIDGSYDFANDISDSLIVERTHKVARAIRAIRSLDELAQELLSAECARLEISLDEVYRAAIPLMWIFDIIDTSSATKTTADLSKIVHVFEALDRAKAVRAIDDSAKLEASQATY